VTQPSADPRLPLAGDKFAGKYEIVRVIGEGGMGIVYEAMHLRLQQRVAIKLLQPRVLYMPDVVARFEREARAACRLRSRHAVRILDVDQVPGGLAYMVMEYLEGHDLSQELHHRVRLQVAEAVDYVLQACVAMAEAHASGVVHRDLKPSNLFLVDEAGRRTIKVLDFGISKMTTDGESHVTSTFATMGTPLYMSPEQIRSAKNVDARTDIWALGVILYELLLGERPFAGTTTAAAAAIVADNPPPLHERIDLPAALEQVVMTALAKKPEDRFRDVRALAEALAPFAPDAEHLRTMRAEAMAISPPRLTDKPPRPQSTPSFVHAATVAQPTPAKSTPPSASAEPPSSALKPGAMISRAGPTTTAGWSTHGEKTLRASRVKLAVFAALGVAVIGGAAIGWVKMRREPPTAGPSATLSAPETPPETPPAPPPPAIATATSIIPASPPTPTQSSGAAASTVNAVSASTTSPRHTPRSPTRAGNTAPASLTKPAGATAPSPPQAPPAPTATNPLHL
jgi:serine/threonine protein kinase